MSKSLFTFPQEYCHSTLGASARASSALHCGAVSPARTKQGFIGTICHTRQEHLVDVRTVVWSLSGHSVFLQTLRHQKRRQNIPTVGCFLLSVSLSALDPGRQNGRLSPAHHQSPPLHLLGLIPTLLGPAPPQHTCLPPPSVTVEDSVF